MTENVQKVVLTADDQTRAAFASFRASIKSARESTDMLTESTDLLKTGLGALGVGLSINSFANMVRGVIDAGDRLNDLRKISGLTVEQLGGLEKQAKLNGTSLDQVARSIGVMSKQMYAGAEAFKVLGIETRNADGSLRGVDPVLLDVADRFSRMEDGATKSALANQLFGKSGRDLIPMLSEGRAAIENAAAAYAMNSGMTTKLAADSDKFNDTLTLLNGRVTAIKNNMVAELLPTLNNIGTAMLTATDGSNKFSASAQLLNPTLKGLALIGYTVADTFNGVGRSIGAAIAQAMALGKLDPQRAIEIGQELNRLNVESRASYDAFVKTVLNGDQALEQINEEQAKTIKLQTEHDAKLKRIKEITDSVITKQEIYNLRIKELNELRPDLGADVYSRALKKAHDELMQGAPKIKAYSTELHKLKEAERDLAGARDIEYRKLKEHEELMKRVKQTALSVASAQDIYNQKIEELNRQRPWLTVDEYTRALEKAERELNGMTRTTGYAVDEMSQLWMQAGRNIQSTLASSIFDFFSGGLDDMWRNAKMAVGRILSEFAALKLAQSIGLTAMFAVPGSAVAAGSGGGFNLNSALSLGSIGTNALSMFKSGFGATSLLSSAGSYLPGSVGSFFSGMAMPASQTAAASFASGAWGASGVSSAAGMGASFASIAGPAIALAAVDAIGRMLAGDKKLGGAEYIPVIGGFLAAMFGRGPYKFRQQSLEGTVTAGGFDGTMTDVYRSKGGWFMGNKHKSVQTPLSAEMDAFFDAQISGYSKSIHEFSKNLGFSTDFIDTYNKEIQIKSAKKQKLTEEAIAEMLDGIGNEFAAGVLPIVETLKKAGEDSFDTLSRLNTEYITLVDASATILGKTLADSRAMIGGASFEGRTSFIDAAGGAESLAGFAQFFAQNFLTAEEQLRPKVDKLTEQLTGLGLSADLSVEQYKGLIQSFGQVNGVSESLWISLKNLGPALLDVRNAQDALTASSLELAKRANMDKINDILRDRQLDMDDATAAAIKAQTEVDTAFAALQRAVEGQRKSLSDDYNDSLKAVKISIADVTGQVGKLKDLSGVLGSALDSMRGISFQEASLQIQSAIESAAAGNFVDAEEIKSAVNALTKINAADFGTQIDFQRAQAKSASQLGELNKLAGKELTLQERTLAALNDRALRLEEEFGLANKQLDQVLSEAKTQIDVLRGIDTSVLSVASAIDALQIRMQAASVAAGGVAALSSAQAASNASDVDIRTFFATPRTPEEIALAAIENNVSSERIAGVMNFTPAQVDAFFKDNPLIPKFASGTSYVPRTGPAIVHQGERIINPEQNQDLIKLLEKLVQKISDGNTDTAELLRVLKSMRVETNDGIAIRNQVAA